MDAASLDLTAVEHQQLAQLELRPYAVDMPIVLSDDDDMPIFVSDDSESDGSEDEGDGIDGAVFNLSPNHHAQASKAYTRKLSMIPSTASQMECANCRASVAGCTDVSA